MELYRNEHFHLWAEADNHVMISVKEPGFMMTDFNEILKQIPRLTVTQFLNLRNALAQAGGPPVRIGTLKPTIEVKVAKDWMSATVKLNMDQEEIDSQQKELPAEIIEQLRAAGVSEGYLVEQIYYQMKPYTEAVVAQGIEPVEGTEASVRYYEISERKPRIDEDGKADYFDMNFIDEVKAGDWLGEKIPPGSGIPGRNLKGELIPSRHGKDKRLQYDRKTVQEVEEDGKIVLRALINGAVEFRQRSIGVLEILTINGDVGPKTGNVDYDGCIKITGTVLDGFSVTATRDISILGDTGIGAVDRITSYKGDIYVRGSVFGKEKAILHAARNVYVNNANDCSITAGDDIHIGNYALGSTLQAKNILLNKRRGRIVGGNVQAKVRVQTAFIGNEIERPTRVLVEGFNRNQIKNELDTLLRDYQKMLSDITMMKKELDLYSEFIEKLDDDARQEYYYNLDRQETAMLKVHELEERRQALLDILRTRGEGEVSVMQRAFPKTMLQIKTIEKHIDKMTSGTFYISNNQLHLE
ncbi:DUF342 domain-containing protein [Paenibacillus sp. y28]|uniref:DUF342 domain-containing protein n=1 Tax=Paenibacillus sp. y28 TaxID=3129110 RepID=UPI0030168F51